MSKRLIQFDILRVMAMIFVIAIHVSVRPFVTNPYMKNMWYVLFLVCNGLFYMLSGKFNLRKKFDSNKSILEFYWKNFKKIVIPFFFATMIIAFRYYLSSNFGLSLMGYFRFYRDYITNTAPNSDLWFMYPFFGLLLSTPFLSLMLNNMSEKQIKFILVLSFIYCFYSVNSKFFGFTPHISQWIISEWMLYYILGYCLDRVNIQCEGIIYVLGVVGFILSIILKTKFENSYNNSTDLSLIYVIFVFSIYIFFAKRIHTNNKALIGIIEILTKYSFYVYLFHEIVLREVEKYLGVLNPIISFPVNILVTLLLTLMIAVIFDSFMQILNKFFNTLFIFLKNILFNE